MTSSNTLVRTVSLQAAWFLATPVDGFGYSGRMEFQGDLLATWEHVSDEVLATVLSCLKPQLERTRASDDHQGRLDYYNQSWFLSLPLVCKTFYRVFESNPQLRSNLCLDKQHNSQRFVQLLSWVRGRNSCITHISASSDTPYLDAVLAVIQPDSCLDSVCVEVATDHVISLLASFRTLTHCTFLKPAYLSLKALEALPKLTTLKLIQATYVTDLEALAHLTALHMHSSRSTCKHNFQSVTTLLRLEVEFSFTRRFHDCGVLACSHLLSLKVRHAYVEAVDCSCSVIVTPGTKLILPNHLAGLSALTQLTLCGAVLPDPQSSLQWARISQLQSLQHLVYKLPFDCLKLSEGVAALTKLTVLHVSSYEQSEQVSPQLDVDIDWAMFQVLRCVVFGGGIAFNAKLNDLAALRTLERFSVYDMQGDRRASQEWIKLADWFGTQRPQVLFQYVDCVNEPEISANSYSAPSWDYGQLY